jgi:hypothetical protein
LINHWAGAVLMLLHISNIISLLDDQKKEKYDMDEHWIREQPAF